MESLERANEMNQSADGSAQDFDAVIVGAGFAGLYAVHRLRGLGLRVRAYERGAGVGGTWYWNKYPGCRCDIESIWYSYSFSDELQQEWTWTHRYAAQPEILAYLNYVADRFDLRRDIQLETTVTGMAYDEASQTWAVELDTATTVRAPFVVLASGFLSDPIVPDISGVNDFDGVVLHTASWPEQGVALRGKRVGIIGTGSSGIQSIPLIAEEAGHLVVFQRTAQYAIPAWNAPIPSEEMDTVKRNYPAMRRTAWEDTIGGVPFEAAPHDAKAASPEERDAWLNKTWARGGYLMIASYPDTMFDEETNAIVGDWVKERIRERVDDPEIAEKLMPRYPFAAKRLCVDTDYFETYNRDNVTLVDLGEVGIERVVQDGVRLADGSLIELDVLIFATGFDAGIGAIMRINPVGRGGLTIREKWSEAIAAHLGVMVAGFPNMFLIDGPGSPSVLYNMPPAIEHHVDWIAETIEFLREHEQRTIEPEVDAELEWVDDVNEIAERTVYPKANSWYMGANVSGKKRTFLAWAGGGPPYFERVRKVVDSGYQGFRLEPGGVDKSAGKRGSLTASS
jgi:cyclohexanone monooxygenase